MVLLFCEWFCSIVPQSRAQKKGAYPLPCSGPPAHTAVDRYGILNVVGRGAVVSPRPGRDQNVFPALHLGQTGKAEPCLPGVAGLTAQNPATVQLCAVQLAQQGSIMGPILAMLISIVPSVLITWFAAKMGYQGGHEYLGKLQGGDLMEKLMYVCGIVGLMSVGGMIATLIGATTPLQFAEGTVVIQDILDGMMPQMISLGLTGLMYWLIKKNVNTGWLLVIAIVGGIALSAVGILA